MCRVRSTTSDPALEAARDVANADEPADVQAAHQPLGAPLGGEHGAHGAVEVDRDRERLGRGPYRPVASSPPATRTAAATVATDEQDEEQRANGGEGTRLPGVAPVAVPAARARSSPRARES